MESTLFSVCSSTTSILHLPKSIYSRSTPFIVRPHRCFSTILPPQLAHLQLGRCVDSSQSGSASRIRGSAPLELHRNRLQFCPKYAASYASGGGGFGGFDGGAGGGGGGGDGAAEGGDATPSAVTPGVTEASALNTDVIVLDVRGMTCGGCAASVKRILESQPQVSSASVDLTAETAFVWPVSEAKVAPNWRKDVGEALAKHLTDCGFKSNLKDQESIDGDIQL